MNLEDITNPKTSLQDLAAHAPGVWRQVLCDLEGHIKSGKMEAIAELRATSQSTLKRWQEASPTQLGGTQHAFDTILKARLTVSAIDQWSDVMTGKTGSKPHLKDRLVMSRWILPFLSSGKTYTRDAFDGVWKWIKDPLWAAAELQRHGYWSIPTKEFCDRVEAQAQGRSILEIGAGRGLLYQALQGRGLNLRAVDDGSWEASYKTATQLPDVERMDAVTALKKLKPAVVICSWPPPSNEFEQHVFLTPSVQLYLAVVSKYRFASGNWKCYQAQSQFSCSTSEPLNQMLRPIEADQQVLLFRRR